LYEQDTEVITMKTFRIRPLVTPTASLTTAVAALFMAWLSMAPASASIDVTIDKLDIGDGVPLPPANLVVVDLYVAVSPDDAWTASQLHGETSNGATLVYAHDPNLPEYILLTAPGTDQRFVTFFSAPRGRDANGRFTSSGMVQVVGNYC